jgi:hypothetical protein
MCVLCVYFLDRVVEKKESSHLRFPDRNSLRSGNNDSRGQTAKETMVYNTADILQIGSHFSCVLNGGLKVKVDNVVAIVSDGNFISIDFVGRTGSHAKDGLASGARVESRDDAHGVLVAKGSDFDGDGETRAQAIGKLGLVDCKRGEMIFIESVKHDVCVIGIGIDTFLHSVSIK